MYSRPKWTNINLIIRDTQNEYSVSRDSGALTHGHSIRTITPKPRHHSMKLEAASNATNRLRITTSLFSYRERRLFFPFFLFSLSCLSFRAAKLHRELEREQHTFIWNATRAKENCGIPLLCARVNSTAVHDSRVTAMPRTRYPPAIRTPYVWLDGWMNIVMKEWYVHHYLCAHM